MLMYCGAWLLLITPRFCFWSAFTIAVALFSSSAESSGAGTTGLGAFTIGGGRGLTLSIFLGDARLGRDGLTVGSLLD